MYGSYRSRSLSSLLEPLSSHLAHRVAGVVHHEAHLVLIAPARRAQLPQALHRRRPHQAAAVQQLHRDHRDVVLPVALVARQAAHRGRPHRALLVPQALEDLVAMLLRALHQLPSRRERRAPADPKRSDSILKASQKLSKGFKSLKKP